MITTELAQAVEAEISNVNQRLEQLRDEVSNHEAYRDELTAFRSRHANAEGGGLD